MYLYLQGLVRLPRLIPATATGGNHGNGKKSVKSPSAGLVGLGAELVQ